MATNAHICVVFMEWAGLQTLDDIPKSITIPIPRSKEKQQQEFLENVLSKFVECVLVEFDRGKALQRKNKQNESASEQTEEPVDVNAEGLGLYYI